MSSSDSEGDNSFLNIAQKLSAMKNNYRVDNECVLNDSTPLGSIQTTSPTKNKRNKSKSPAKAKRKKSTDSCSSDSIDLETFRSAFPPINEPKPKRNTRSAAKRKSASVQNSPNLADSQLSLPKRKKGRKTVDTSATESLGNSSATVDETPPINRGRGRSRGRGRGRGRNNSANTRRSRHSSNAPTILDMLQAMIPIYSVGNTDEYPDQCDNQQLFSNCNHKNNDVVEIEDLDETLEENEVMSVKVEWMSAKIFKFDLRKYQKFTPVFEHFSKQESVSYDKLYFSYNGRILKPDDTPDSIDYSIAKFIDGGIVSQSVSQLVSNNVNKDKDGIILKFQCQNVKKPFEIVVKPDDKMATAMLRCAEHYEKPLEKLRFEFDGDIIMGKSTPRELDLDGGGCIDVKILN